MAARAHAQLFLVVPGDRKHAADRLFRRAEAVRVRGARSRGVRIVVQSMRPCGAEAVRITAVGDMKNFRRRYMA